MRRNITFRSLLRCRHLIIDIDGNIYHSIIIGSLEFMVENLKTTKYTDGSSIPVITDQVTWDADTVGAMCYFNNDPTNGLIYGPLYSWNAVNNAKGLAPIGWRVMTKVDAENMSNVLGGGLISGGKLKEVGLSHWASPNTGATNSSGFTALPGGLRNVGFFNLLGYYYGGWLATEFDTLNASYMDLAYTSDHFQISTSSKCVGFSVRCVRDVA